MRREERMTVQGPVKKQQPDEMSHRGAVGVSSTSALPRKGSCGARTRPVLDVPSLLSGMRMHSAQGSMRTAVHRRGRGGIAPWTPSQTKGTIVQGLQGSLQGFGASSGGNPTESRAVVWG